MRVRDFLTAAAIGLGTIITATGPATAQSGIPAFATTCVPVTQGAASRVCIASNGSMLVSEYNFRNSIPTKGTHTGCSLRNDFIVCSGGTWQTASQKGQMTAFRVRMNGGTPHSASW